MIYKVFILCLVFASCTSSTTKISDPKSCLVTIDSIASNQTFREAISPTEKCVQENGNDIKLNLRLAEFYLLSYLVDNEDQGYGKSINQFSKTLNIDSSFSTNYSDFNLEKNKLIELSEIWFKIQSANYDVEKERILIWALIDNFDPSKTPKLIK